MMQRQRKAFSMLTALFVIVIMATVGVLVMNMTGKITKETTTQYQKEQAILLAKSYTELAIMAVTANDRVNDTCLYDIDAVDVLGDSSEGEGYRVRTRIAYIGNNLGTCTGVRVLNSTVATLESSLNIIVDVYVEYKELDNPTSKWITYHRRTLQKI